MRQMLAWACYSIYMRVPARFALSMPEWFMALVGDYAYHPSRFKP